MHRQLIFLIGKGLSTQRASEWLSNKCGRCLLVIEVEDAAYTLTGSWGQVALEDRYSYNFWNRYAETETLNYL